MLTLQCRQIPDPKNPGRELPYPAFVYKYDQEKADDFDWNDEIEVGKLTAWRSQIRYRNFPPTRKERAFWLEIELAKITHMMKKQLESSNTIKWNRLANEFNEDNRGRIRKWHFSRCRNSIFSERSHKM